MRVALALFVVGMWVMLLAISAFLVLVVAPLEGVAEGMPWMVVSGFQAAIAIGAVVLFVLALGRLKHAYVNRRLSPL